MKKSKKKYKSLKTKENISQMSGHCRRKDRSRGAHILINLPAERLNHQ
jgi:hypothetical protein